MRGYIRINTKIGIRSIVNKLISDFDSDLSSSPLEKKLNKLVITNTIIAKIKIPIPQPIHAMTSQPFGAKLGNIAGAKATIIEVTNRNKPK